MTPRREWLIYGTTLWLLQVGALQYSFGGILRAVASLTVPGGQEFHFPHFSSNFDQFILFFLKLYSFSSSFWFSGWAVRPPVKALATPLGILKVYTTAGTTVYRSTSRVPLKLLNSYSNLQLPHGISVYGPRGVIRSLLCTWCRHIGPYVPVPRNVVMSLLLVSFIFAVFVIPLFSLSDEVVMIIVVTEVKSDHVRKRGENSHGLVNYKSRQPNNSDNITWSYQRYGGLHHPRYYRD